MKELTSPQGRFVVFLVLAAAAARLIPHEPNFTPVGAMALFGGTYLVNKRMALAVPLAAMLLSDIGLELLYGNGYHASIFFVYGSFVLVGALGFLLRRRIQRQTIMVASLVGSLLFFFVTNFGSWLTSHGHYALNATGLVECYIAGIPFFKGTVMGDLFYNLALFGGYAFIRRFVPGLALR